MTRRLIGWLMAGMTLLLVGCDQGTKFAAEAALHRHRGLTVLPGLLDFRYTENHDTAFSMLRSFDFEGKMLMLTVGSTLSIFGVIALWWYRRESSWLEQAATRFSSRAVSGTSSIAPGAASSSTSSI